MNTIIKGSLIILIWLIMSTAFANNRPTLQFNGLTYYLARSYYEVDSSFSPVNVIEFYLPEGETSDNYSKYIKRVTLLEVANFKSSASARIHEFLEDNKQIPYDIKEDADGIKSILNVSFWWPFRPSVVNKMIFVFQEDKKAKRAMYYIVGEDAYYENQKISNEELVKQGKALLLDDKIVKQAKDLAF